MNKIFLNLVPIRFKCPFCGKWHQLNEGYKLSDYSKFNGLILDCPERNSQIKIFFSEGIHRDFDENFISFKVDFKDCPKIKSLIQFRIGLNEFRMLHDVTRSWVVCNLNIERVEKSCIKIVCPTFADDDIYWSGNCLSCEKYKLYDEQCSKFLKKYSFSIILQFDDLEYAITSHYQKCLEELKNTFDKKIIDSNNENEGLKRFYEEDKIKKWFEEEKKKIKKEFKKKLDDFKKSYKTLTNKMEKQLSMLERDYEKKVEQLAVEYEDNVKEIKSSYNQEIKKLTSKFIK